MGVPSITAMKSAIGPSAGGRLSGAAERLLGVMYMMLILKEAETASEGDQNDKWWSPGWHCGLNLIEFEVNS